MRDKLWFFVSARSWGFSRKVANLFWNQTTHPGAPPTGEPFFLTPPGAERKVINVVPWLDRPNDRYSGRLEWYDAYLGKGTWQATDRQKFNLLIDRQEGCNCGGTSASSLQERNNGYRFDPNTMIQASYTNALTSRLLLEVGTTFANSQWNTFFMPGVERDHIDIRDRGTGLRYGASSFYRGDPNETDRFTQRFSVSYVTGSHNFKVGAAIEELVANTYQRMNGNVHYQFRNDVPILIEQGAWPYLERSRLLPDLGIYAQDQWTIDQLTLNLGIRVDGVPNWKDISPRFGGAYDLFGDGQTAVKVAFGRYAGKMGTSITQNNNPIRTSVNSTTRSWNDANGDYVPDCDLGDFTANGECGAIANNNFGKNNTRATRWADELLNGWNGHREYNWDLSLELVQELADGLSVTGGFYQNTGGYRESRGNKQRVTDNLAVTPADYDPYCITAPVDARLPGGGGNEICGLYDITPEKFGQVDNLNTLREPYRGRPTAQPVLRGDVRRAAGERHADWRWVRHRAVD